MLLWMVLGGVLILVVWVLFYWILAWGGTAFAVIMTILIVLAVGAVWGAKKLLARRAAKKIETELARQAAEQAAGAKPERRAEIQELQKKLLEGIAAIKTSKSGSGGKLGAAALYAMPWYMIIGPPGAGKTTALKHSGLVFPGGNAGGVRGVGGTRNCDWWLTNEAIILDTAGRYAIEQDDREEWIAFLQFLLKHRQKKPINGIIIAISINELLDASEQQIEVTGKKLRARVDEVITQLHMVVPVYMLFTKIDLIAGFTEFFGDLKKSDRAQVWGATLPLNMPKNEPGKLFDTEFELLVKHLHSRGLKRCVQERSREAREKLFRFPIEFANLKKNLSDLVAVTFAPNTFQGTPLFRGYYFTSGTQEGKPIDRVLERMSAAMGIRNQAPAAGAAQPQANPNIESKSYFLYNLFINVIFKDGNVGMLSALEERRQTTLKLIIAAATVGLAALLCLPALSSYSNNKNFMEQSLKQTTETSKLRWDDETDLSKKPAMLAPTLELLKKHDEFEIRGGAPWGWGWWMFKADKLYQPTLKVYARLMTKGVIEPCMKRLEEKLQTADPLKYLQTRTLLKQYLLLSEVKHLGDAGMLEWATGRYTKCFVEVKKATSNVTDNELKELFKGHIEYFLGLLQRGKIEPIKADEALVERVRTALQNVPIPDRYYDLIVNSLNDEMINEAGEPSIDNKVFPPVQLPRIFPNLPLVNKHFKSRKHEKTQAYQEVEGPYTEKGQAAVVKQIEKAEGLLKSEAWVVPLTKDETVTKIPIYVGNVKTRYEEIYIKQWTDFFLDIDVSTPQADQVELALEILSTVGTPDASPHMRLIESLATHTQFRNANPLESNDAIAREANRRFNQKLNMYTYGIIVNVDLKEIAKRTEKIPSKFVSTTKLIEQPRGVAGAANPVRLTGNNKIFEYIEIVRNLREKIEDAKSKARDPKDGPLSLLELSEDFVVAQTKARALLKDFDATANQLMLRLLLMPIDLGGRATYVPDPAVLNRPDKPASNIELLNKK